MSLVISDLVDEDAVLHNRPNAVSALIFGTAALLSKPGQTLAPIIGTWILSLQTGKSLLLHLDEVNEGAVSVEWDMGSVLFGGCGVSNVCLQGGNDAF